MYGAHTEHVRGGVSVYTQPCRYDAHRYSGASHRARRACAFEPGNDGDGAEPTVYFQRRKTDSSQSKTDISQSETSGDSELSW